MDTQDTRPRDPGRAGTGGGSTERRIRWPILLIGRDDHFVHVLDERGFDLHHEGPGLPPPSVAPPSPGRASEGPGTPGHPPEVLDFFDRDGQRLRPVVGSDLAFRGVEATGVLVPVDVLLARLDRAVRWARSEMAGSGVTVVDPPVPPTTDYGRYLDYLVTVFATVPSDGSAWHNFIHLIT